MKPVAPIVTIAGGVGAARFLSGLVQVVDPASVAAIVNTGDDTTFHGLHVSPDIDTVTYTLGRAINQETGWGLEGESWQAMHALRRYESAGALTWFNLGDRDLATHMFRTDRLERGATLSEVTEQIARAWNVAVQIVPMSDDRVSTNVRTATGVIGFQEYFVKLRHDVAVLEVIFDGIEAARPAPQVLPLITNAQCIIICPSNPVVSIGPVLGVAGIRQAITARRDVTVAISPIVAGAALKGPADRLMTELGFEASVVGVARMYRDIAATLIIDEADRALAGEVEAQGVRCVVCDTIMSKPGVGADLARTVLRDL